ncbi:MAG: zinc metallopeptidase [Bacteroidales bacterium]|nr:zinc metallopeptidase [Bacteroidales bacterium]
MMIWIIFIALTLASLLVQGTLRRRFARYSQEPLSSGLTGAQVAQKMLYDNGIYDVSVIATNGTLTDHYDPTKKTIALSEDVYNSCSIAAAAVAAHETGHAVQDATAYAPLRMRSALVPVVKFASMTVQWVILAGLILINVFPNLLWVGIAMFAMTTLFSLITLPVEVNASRRAIAWLTDSGVVDYDNRPMAIDALKWAAFTYFIAAVSSLATLFYYIGIARR